MPSLFARLFTSSAKTADGLTQSQREAIVDLLHFCMCADDRVLRVEERMIAVESVRFRWEGPVSYDVFATGSYERAQQAVRSFVARADCINGIGDRLSTAAAKENALNLCQRVFLADREYPDSEQVTFREIRCILEGSATQGQG